MSKGGAGADALSLSELQNKMGKWEVGLGAATYNEWGLRPAARYYGQNHLDTVGVPRQVVHRFKFYRHGQAESYEYATHWPRSIGVAPLESAEAGVFAG